MLIVVAGLIERDDKLLITQRPPQKHGALKWEFPGGKLEEGEDPRNCLIREIKEELNLEVAVHRIAEVIFHRYPDRSVLVLFYSCTWVAGEPQAIDCADFAWVERAHLMSYDFLEADLDLIKHLAERRL